MERRIFSSSQGPVSYLHRNGEYPMIFLHGFGGSGNNWMKLSNHLDGSLELFYPDLLGHGRSNKQLERCLISDQCRMLEEFIEHMHIKEFGLVGHSFGGWISLRFSLSFSKPEYLVLIDSAGLNQTAGSFDKNRRDAFIDSAMHGSMFNDRPILERMLISNADDRERIDPADLREISSSTLIIWGEQDRIIPIRYGEIMHSQIRNSTFEVLKNTGHTPQTEHYRKISSLINGLVHKE